MKYSILRNKQVGDKDLELNKTYKKKRLQEVREQELNDEYSYSEGEFNLLEDDDEEN